MFMILWWKGDYLTCIKNKDDSIKLFTLPEADDYANKHPKSDDLRVISIEGVKV